ncbi:hypothetical protein SAMN02745129_2141 [Ferrimonas marina]|uniref:Uncharacterized protein n=1 Tax=Ferrimonas marina TaxID=299255 RepID=A0A1M5TGY6_9GAMM|nr:hypothetical protein SAMN02745129_2141 [Ferrimonas marina]
MELTWEGLIERFSSSVPLKEKKAGSVFLPIALVDVLVPQDRPSGDGVTYRHEGNVSAMTMLVLDLDEPGALERANKVLGRYQRLLYSTFSRTTESPDKYRLVLPLSAPVEAGRWQTLYAGVAAEIGSDTSCGNLSRSYFLPSHQEASSIPPVFEVFDGEVLSPDALSSFKRIKTPSGRPRKVRRDSGVIMHPSMTIVPRRLYRASEAGWDKESMQRRHASRIEAMAESGHRHAFALGVTGAEVDRFGKDVDWQSVVSFLYDMAQVHSGRPLWLGDTPKELPGMVTSAYRKFGANLSAAERKKLTSELVDLMKTATATGRAGQEYPYGAAGEGQSVLPDRSPLSRRWAWLIKLAVDGGAGCLDLMVQSEFGWHNEPLLAGDFEQAILGVLGQVDGGALISSQAWQYLVSKGRRKGQLVES